MADKIGTVEMKATCEICTKSFKIKSDLLEDGRVDNADFEKKQMELVEMVKKHKVNCK